MAAFKEVVDSIGSWLMDIVQIGLSLAMVFFVVDLLFGEKTGIVSHVVALVNSFVSQGVVGLIALIVFIAIYKK